MKEFLLKKGILDLPVDIDEIIENLKTNYSWEIWDKKSPINGIESEQILKRKDIIYGGEIYLIKRNNKIIIFQPHSLNMKAMDLSLAISSAKEHIDNLVLDDIKKLLTGTPELPLIEQKRLEKIKEIQNISNAIFDQMSVGYTKGEIGFFCSTRSWCK